VRHRTSNPFRRLAVAGTLAALGVVAHPLYAVTPQTWSASPEALARGDADGVAVSERGVLTPAPRLIRLGEEEPAARPDHVWAMTSGAGGRLYLGTGPEGRVIEVGPAGRQRVLFEADEPMITALAVLRDGSLLAGTAPGGKIFRIDADGSSELFCETGEHYIWTLVVTDDNRIFAGTGEQGAILEIERSGTAELFFDSDEAHIVALYPRADGTLLAGGAGRGSVYLVDRDGNGIVLHDDALHEVVALADEGDGNVLAALVDRPTPEKRPPALRLRLPDGVEVGVTDENVGTLEESQGPVLHGVIEGLPGTPDGKKPRLRGRLVRIRPSGETNELWRSSTEAPYSLLGDGGQRTLFGTGEPARLYGIEPGGDVALLATLRESQLTELLRFGPTVYGGTSNPASVYRLERGTHETGVFISPALDAGGPARWGSISWRVEGDSGRVEIYTRTGNSNIPDGTWSGWSPMLVDPAGSRIDNPDGRFLQWRARFVGAKEYALRLSSVTVRYEPYNRSPEIRDFRTEHDERAVASLARFVYAVFDADLDPLDIHLEYRALGSGTWDRVARPEADGKPSAVETSTNAGHAKDKLTWETTALTQGPYEVRLVVSDQPANPPGEGRQVPREPALELAIDYTPPEVETRLLGDGTIEIVVSDAYTDIRRLELLRGDRRQASLRPVDGICDSRREVFRIDAPDDGADWSVRGVDSAGNKTDSVLPQ
jgi:hypothetical protein